MRPKVPKRLLVFFMMTFLAATSLFAQERCQPDETIESCLNRLLGPDTYVTAAMRAEREDLQRQPTGVDTVDTNVSTATKDFNPLMALAGLLGTGTDSTDDAQGTLLFNFNFGLPVLGSQGAKNAQLQALVNTQPQLSERILNEIPQADRDREVSRLEGQIEDLADSTLRFTYNFTTRHLGRSFKQYEQEFRELCLSTAERTVNWPQGRDELKTRIMNDLTESMPDLRGRAFKDMPLEMADEALRKVEEEGRQMQDLYARALDAEGIWLYDQLVDNQPQLHITAERRFREPLVGPDELSVKVTYEMSWANLNEATDDCGENWDSEACWKGYRDYVKANQKAIQTGHRLTFSGEYVDTDGESVDAGLATPVVFESARKLMLSLGWSRKIFLGEGEPIKLDLVGTYENVSDDPNRRDRGIASLTFTRRVGEMEIPFSVVYANHGEFFPADDVDARLSAHIGIKFKMSGGNGDS